MTSARQIDNDRVANIGSTLPEPGGRCPQAAAGLDGLTGEIALILREEPDLAAGLTPADRHVATDAFRAAVIAVTDAHWQPPALDEQRCFGLLVLDGLVGRRVRIGTGVAMELLGAGDILRPWDDAAAWDLIPPDLEWRAFRPSRLAVLDERVTALIGRRPELVVAFSGRLLRRARVATYLTAIAHLTRVEDRLLAALWHLASRWGRVTPGGVVIPFRLSHAILGEIIGAQRPSVTVALRGLRERGQVLRSPEGGYVLRGDPEDWRPGRG